MNDQTIKFLHELADKLGTNTEHLWGALLRQAPISSFCDLLGFPISLAIIYVFARLTIKGHKAEENNLDYGIPLMVVSGIITIIGGILLICCIGGLSMTLAGFFNPEYWALKQIIK